MSCLDHTEKEMEAEKNIREKLKIQKMLEEKKVIGKDGKGVKEMPNEGEREA